MSYLAERMDLIAIFKWLMYYINISQYYATVAQLHVCRN